MYEIRDFIELSFLPAHNIFFFKFAQKLKVWNFDVESFFKETLRKTQYSVIFMNSLVLCLYGIFHGCYTVLYDKYINI